MITLRPWGPDDEYLLHLTLGDPAMMQHLGGIETPEQIAARHLRFLRPSECGGMFTIRLPDGTAAGTIGFWDKPWREQTVYETGWFVLQQYAGRGIATQAALEIIELARREGKYRFMHAFPAVENAPSNGVCRKAGFTNLGPCTFEYPKGHFMQCNDWRFDLSHADRGKTAARP